MRTPRRSIVFLLLALAAGAVPTLAADTPDLDEIVRRTNHTVYYQGTDGRARATLTVTDPQGRTRVKEFTILRRDMGETDADQRFYVYFHRPADERGVTFLVWKHAEGDDDRWLYLPALDVQKRIAAADKRTSFVGSHFFYEDVSGRRLEDDVHELVEVTDTYFVLRNTPKRPEEVEFDSYTMWIHRGSFLPVEVRYEKDGQPYRVAKTLAVEKIQGHTTVTRSQMTDLRTGGHTILEYSSVEYDLGLDENLFTERYLRNPPRKYLD